MKYVYHNIHDFEYYFVSHYIDHDSTYKSYTGPKEMNIYFIGAGYLCSCIFAYFYILCYILSSLFDYKYCIL